MKSYENILIENQGRVRIITINREAKLNALNANTITELGEVIHDTEKNEAIRAVVLTGAGAKAFVAGADIAEFSDFNAEQGEALARNGQQLVFDAIHHCSKPFIAAINGFALGGGLELAMSCHIRVAAQQAKLGLPEVTLGLIPGYGGTQRLTQLVGRGKAMEMILTADMVGAEDALAIGLVNHVVPAEELMSKALELANKIATRSGSAVAAGIKTINASMDSSVDGFDVEIRTFGSCFASPDFKEGVSAFLEKRKPNFN